MAIFLFPLPKTVESAKSGLEKKYSEEMMYDASNTYANEIKKKGFFDINEYDINYKYSFTGKKTNYIYLYNPNTQEVEIIK